MNLVVDIGNVTSYLPYAIERMEDAMKPAPMSLERLKEVFDYDAEAGHLIWKAPTSNAVKVGEVAGGVAANGRRYVSLANGQIPVHRLAWYCHYGVWPEGYIRHRDLNYDNNRIGNLYEATPSATNRDRALAKNNKTGVIGVTFDRHRGKWKAQIKYQYQDTHLGYFDTKEEATAARLSAEERIAAATNSDEAAFVGGEEKAKRWRRLLWRLTVSEYSGNVGWTSQEAFEADVGTPPGAKYTLVAKDASHQIGPGNWEFLPPRSERYDLDTPEGRSAYRSDHHRANPHLARNDSLKKHYGKTLADHQRMVLEQKNGVCAICAKPETATYRSGELKALAMDHDHAEGGQVRGLLCQSCNTGLGFFKDDPEVLRRAASYLEAHAEKGMAA